MAEQKEEEQKKEPRRRTEGRKEEVAEHDQKEEELANQTYSRCGRDRCACCVWSHIYD